MQQLNKETDFSWHAEQPDVPGLSATEMKEFLDAPVHTLVDKVNEVIGAGEAVDLSTLNTEVTALKKSDTELKDEITALNRQSINITKVILEGLSDLGTQQDSHSTAINELGTQQENHSTAINNLSTQQKNHSTAIDNLSAQQDSQNEAINELVAQQASTAPVFIDHFDLTVEEINNIYTQCILKDRALVIKEGTGKYVCSQVYANGTGDQIAFIYTKCSSSGVVTFNRHGYVMKSGMHYPTVYTLQTM